MWEIRSSGWVAHAVAAVVGLAVLASGCGGDEPSGTATVEEPAASVATPAPKQRSGTRPFGRQPGPIEPGRYATTAFEPTFAATLGPGWQVLSQEESGFFTLARGEDAMLAFVRPTRVLDPTRTYRTDIPADAVMPAPTDLAAWHADHPRLTTGPRQRTSIGGRPATRFDVRVRDGYESAGCPASCVLFFAPTPERVVFATEGQVIRNFLLEAGGGPLLVGVLSSEQGFEAAVRAAQKVLATLEFEP